MYKLLLPLLLLAGCTAGGGIDPAALTILANRGAAETCKELAKQDVADKDAQALIGITAANNGVDC